MTYSLQTLTHPGASGGAGPSRTATRFAHEIALVAGGAALLFWLIALASYSAHDPAFSTSGNGAPVANWGGRLGAWLADGSYFLLGFSAWWCVAAGARAWLATLARWMRGSGPAPSGWGRSRLAFWAGLAILLCASTGLEWSRLYRFEPLLPDHAGGALGYDYVVYAVGSTGAVPESVPGATEFAYPVAELEQAQRLRATLDELHPDAPVTVVGGGLTGIEVATELAEQKRRVTLVCGGRLGPSLSDPGRRSVAKTLAKLHIAVLEADVVTEVRPGAVVFADGAVRPSALTIWTGGFGVPGLAARSGLSTDALGRLLTDETLTSVDDPRIIAAGDCAAPSGEPLRMCCASASQLGPQAANTVLSRISDEQPAVFEYGFAGTCTSLGRRAAIVQFGRRDDTPVDAYLAGRLAAPLKELICRGTVWSLRREARKPGSAFWLKGGPRPRVAELVAEP